MTTTSITSGTDFIGKTLIIGSTCLLYQDYSKVFDFNNNSTYFFISTMFKNTNQKPYTYLRDPVNGEDGIIHPHIANIGTYYIYVLSFISITQLKYNIYEYDGASTIISKDTTIKTFNMGNTFLPRLTQLWLGRGIFNFDFYYKGIYSKLALYNSDLFALDNANILSTLLTVVTSTQTNIINNNTYIFRSLGTNFLGVVVNIFDINTVTDTNITLNGGGGYLNIIGSYIETATTPDAPTNVIATAGNAQFTITWTASTNDGGSPIISYSVTSSPGNFQTTTADGSTTTATISGLTNGTSYTFTVVATNALGSSTASAASTPVTTSFIAPSAPTNVTASAGNALAIVTWTASTNNGGSAITSYSVTSSPGNFQATTANGSTTTATVSGLTNGTSYTFTVVATNVAGSSTASIASTSIIPSFTVPSAPTNVSAITANAQAIITWSAPTNDGGLPITSYRVTSSPGNFQTITANGSTTTATISGLTNGTAYTFTVLATNALGSSPASIATNYENFNNSSKSFRIYCDKLTSNDISNNLIIKSSNKNIEFKVIDEKRIIFKNDVTFNSSMDLNNKPLTGLITISAESLNLSNVFRGSSVNIINRSQFSDISIDGNNKFLTLTNQIQDLSRSFFYNIDVFNNSSVIVDLNVTLYCSYALNERITIELWRDLSMLVQSKDLGSVIASGGIPIPYNITYLDEYLTAGPKKYYIKYKLENNVINEEQPQGIINVRTSEKTGYASFMLTEITNNSNYSNKIIFDNSNLTTTSYEIQDLSALFYNIIDVFNSNVQVNINATLYCCYGIKERITIEVWRDLSMIAQNTDLGTINATAGLTIPYSFNYLDTNLSNGPKKYYLKYKLQQDPSSNNTNTSKNLGIINLNTLNSIGTSTILLANVPKINSNLLVNNNNSFLTTTSELIDLSGLLFNDIEVDIISSVIVDLNITLFCCYAANERITIQLWRDLSMVFENTDIGNSIATTGLTINYKLSLLDQNISPGTVKYYFKYKLETNSSGQPQGILNVNGGYSIIEQANIGVSYNVLSYASMDYDDGYIKNTKIGYNPNIPGDKGSSSGRRDAYFRYIDVAGSDSRFNDSLYVKKNIIVDGPTRITSDLSVNAIPLSAMFDELSNVETYIAEIAIEFSNNRIKTRDLSASNITISNELYSLNKYYANDLNISGQLLSDVLRVPHEFTLDMSNSNNVYFIPVTDGSWVQMGPDIDGDASNNYAGRVSLNADGTILAIAATGNNSSTGRVKIYQYNNNANDPSWIQLGQDIDGEASLNLSGFSISLNAAGNIVAIGAPLNDGTIINNMFDNRGHVRLYQYNNNPNDPSWIQMGPDIDGEASNDESGYSVSLNASGDIVAIGAPYNNGTVYDRGHVRIYQYNNNPNDPSWIQIGPDIDGEAPDDYSGSYVSLNAVGNIVAIGAPYNDGNGNYSGHVRIYQYNNNINDPSWIQMGRDIDGDASNNYAARVSLNADGTILAIAATGNNSSTGRVKIYQYNNNANDPSWIQLGQDIDGDSAGDQSGFSISLNAVGNILAIGAPYNDGHVRIYQYNNVNDPSWVQMGPDIDGEAPSDYFQYVSLNATGNIVAIGAPYNDGNGSNSGHVRIYQYQETTRLEPVTSGGSFIVNGNLIVNGNRKILHSTILDISAYSIKIATSLRNRTDLSNNPAGFDVSYIAALHYDGTTWNISGGNLLIGNQSVGLDVSLIDLQTTIFGSLIASKSKYDSSFSLLRTNITNSFNSLYTKSQLDNSYVTFSYAYTDISKLKNYIDLSFVTKQTVSISGSAIVQDYVTKAYVDGSFAILNNKLDLSFALKNSVDLSYTNLRGQITNFFANIDAANAAATNIDISAITIETIKTPKLALTSHVSISGDLIVAGYTSSNSLNISNSYLFSNNGYSSIYSPSSNATTIIEEYYSKFNNYGKVFYILADGSLYSLTGRGAISDIRLKENIVDASPKLADLLKVRIVDYNLKNNSNKKYIGVVAQELEELFPSLVETENGPNAKTNYKSVKYSCFNVMLIKALQEQQQIITNLTLRLERLRAKKQVKKQVKENA